MQILKINKEKKTHNPNKEGIYVGNGITEQSTINITSDLNIKRTLEKTVEKGFGYVVKDSVPILTKFLVSRMEVEDE